MNPTRRGDPCIAARHGWEPRPPLIGDRAVTRKGTTMTRMTPLLDRNERFASSYTPVPLGPPTAQVIVVTFDYTSLALLELLRRQVELTRAGGAATPEITAVLMVNGGLFADAHTHPWQGTPLLRSPLGALAMRGWQRSPRAFGPGWHQARMYSRGYHPTPAELAELWSAITRRDGAAFAHNAAGFVAEHRRHADRWDLAAIARELGGTVALYVGGSDEDPYEHRQIAATIERVPQAEILTFPGGHLTTSEHPDLLAAAIREIAARHGVGTPAAARQ